MLAVGWGAGYLNGIDEAGESTLSEIVNLYIVFSHLLTILIVYYSIRG